MVSHKRFCYMYTIILRRFLYVYKQHGRKSTDNILAVIFSQAFLLKVSISPFTELETDQEACCEHSNMFELSKCYAVN